MSVQSHCPIISPPNWLFSIPRCTVTVINGCGDVGKAGKKNYSINSWQHIRVLPPAECWLLLEACSVPSLTSSLVPSCLYWYFYMPYHNQTPFSRWETMVKCNYVNLTSSPTPSFLLFQTSWCRLSAFFSCSIFISSWHLILFLSLIYKSWWKTIQMGLPIRKDAIILSPLQLY